MGVLKIKTSKDTWETIDNLILDNLSLKTGVDENGDPRYEQVNNVIENAVVDVYIHVNSDGTNYTSTDPEITDTGLTLMNWFNKAYPVTEPKARNKAIKGFLIEHQTIETTPATDTTEAKYTTYHLPYYWNGSSWVLLNAIWG